MSGARLAWTIAGVAGAALLGVLALSRQANAAPHPDPRPGATADRVLPPAMVPHVIGSGEAYAAARAMPGLLDGIYCHCECAKNFGHRSLLTCFESDHGANCNICMGEATLAARLAAQGNSLRQIRSAIDRQFSR